MRILRSFWLPTLVVLSACAFRPNMGAAMDDAYLADWDVSEGKADLARVEAELKEMGFRIMERTDGLKRLTTLPDKVLYPAGFREKPPRVQAELLRHEMAHAKQWQALGVYLFGAKYAQESGRWVLEMHGARQQLRDACGYGRKREDLEVWIEETAEAFPKRYLLTPKNAAKAKKATQEALLAELARCQEN